MKILKKETTYRQNMKTNSCYTCNLDHNFKNSPSKKCRTRAKNYAEKKLPTKKQHSLDTFKSAFLDMYPTLIVLHTAVQQDLTVSKD